MTSLGAAFAEMGEGRGPLARRVAQALRQRRELGTCPTCRNTGYRTPALLDGPQYCACAFGQRAQRRDDADREAQLRELADNHRAVLRRTLGFAPDQWTWTLTTSPVRMQDQRAHQVAQAFAKRLAWTDNLILSGPVGVGKTGLIVAILNSLFDEAATRRKLLYFRTLTQVLDDLREAMHSNDSSSTYAHRMHIYASASVLALDEIGVQAYTDWRREALFELLNRRYTAKLPTYITTNLSEAELTRWLDERLMSRLLQRGHCITVGGADQREVADGRSPGA